MKGQAAGEYSKMEPWRRLRSRGGRSVEEERVGGERGQSLSTSCGVVPRTSPSLRVERMRRVRWWESRVLNVGGGALKYTVVAACIFMGGEGGEGRWKGGEDKLRGIEGVRLERR